jgi:TldD protein
MPPGRQARRPPPSREPAHRSREPTLELAPVEVRQDHWENPVAEDPMAVPLAEKGDLLVAVTRTMRDHGADIANAGYDVWDTAKWLVSSEGHRIDQRIRECGARMDATAVGERETQRRSYPGIRGQYGTRGWELVRSLDLPGERGADRGGGARSC